MSRVSVPIYFFLGVQPGFPGGGTGAAARLQRFGLRRDAGGTAPGRCSVGAPSRLHGHGLARQRHCPLQRPSRVQLHRLQKRLRPY